MLLTHGVRPPAVRYRTSIEAAMEKLRPKAGAAQESATTDETPVN